MRSLIVVVTVLMAGCGGGDYNPSAEYCDMWRIWHESGGEYGWPDGGRRYYDECR